jgi:hypothetical protein
MHKQLLDLYSDYLLSSFSYTTATGLSKAVDGEVSHDKITRFLSAEDFTSKDLWKLVKPTVRGIESDEGVLIFDDTIEEKPYTDENDIIAWHFDHVFGRAVKGVNILNCLYHNKGMSLPVAFEVVKKTKKVVDPRTKKIVRKSEKTKNEMMREMLKTAILDMHLKFSIVLADAWFSSSENMKFIKEDMKKEFLMPLKSNRLVALSMTDKQKGCFTKIDALEYQENVPRHVFLEGVQFPVLLLRQVFTNEDGSTGTLYLASSDMTNDATTMAPCYKKRWHVEEYHKSIKSNAGLSKSPTQTVRTQINHFFCSIYAYVKLEKLKMKTGLNHFALKAKLYLRALQASMEELTRLGKAGA